MIKMNSISGVVYFVEDLDKTVKFYEDLGFQIIEKTNEYVKVSVNEFWIDIVDIRFGEKTVYQRDLDADTRVLGGNGQYLHIEVDNTDEFYDFVVSKGIVPTSKPKNFPWGHREFIVRDPDEYKLVFFEKVK